jgi:hypothetical protein
MPIPTCSATPPTASARRAPSRACSRTRAAGRARKEFRGRVPLRRGPDTSVMLDQATDVSLTLVSARGYRLAGPPRVDGARRSFTMTRNAPPVRMVVRLRGGRQAYVEFTATTPCLAPRLRITRSSRRPCPLRP